MRQVTLTLTLTLIFCIGAEVRGSAHSLSFSYATVKFSTDRSQADYELRLSSRDLYGVLGLPDHADASDSEILAGGPVLAEYVFERVSMQVHGQVCTWAVGPVDVVSDGQRFARLSATLGCPLPIEALTLSYGLFFDLDPSHEGLLRIDGELVQFTKRKREHLHNLGHAAPASQWGFLLSGTLHVLSGLDHILFLVSLLLVVGMRENRGTVVARSPRESLREATSIVTAFTAGHSLTLILASLDWIALPSRFVESMIAASILYVAVENLRCLQPSHRYRITLLFGLVHGMGFAAMLQPILPSEGAIVPLLVFNAGVELGQLMVVVLLLPVLLVALGRWGAQNYRRTLVFPASIALGLISFLWLIQRSLLLGL